MRQRAIVGGAKRDAGCMHSRRKAAGQERASQRVVVGVRVRGVASGLCVDVKVQHQRSPCNNTVHTYVSQYRVNLGMILPGTAGKYLPLHTKHLFPTETYW